MVLVHLDHFCFVLCIIFFPLNGICSQFFGTYVSSWSQKGAPLRRNQKPVISPWPCRHVSKYGQSRTKMAYFQQSCLSGYPEMPWPRRGAWKRLLFCCSVMSKSLRPHGLQHARPPCPSPTPGARSNSCPSSRWCHPTISSSDAPFCCYQHQGLFQWVSSSHQVAKVLEFQLQHRSFQGIFRTDFL